LIFNVCVNTWKNRMKNWRFGRCEFLFTVLIREQILILKNVNLPEKVIIAAVCNYENCDFMNVVLFLSILKEMTNLSFCFLKIVKMVWKIDLWKSWKCWKLLMLIFSFIDLKHWINIDFCWFNFDWSVFRPQIKD
jgi:hypothetical protein